MPLLIKTELKSRLKEVSTHRRALSAKSQIALLEPAKRFIRTEAGDGPIVIVGADKMAADELTWAACDTVFTGIYRHTPSQLALELSLGALAGHGVSVADRPRFARAVPRTITELRLEYIAAHQLRQF